MKVRVDKLGLIKGLSALSDVLDFQAHNPVLSLVLLRTQGSFLRITSTDLSIAIYYSMAAQVSDPGVCVVPMQQIASLVHDLPDQHIEILGDNTSITIRTDDHRYVIKCLPLDAFPRIPELQGAEVLELQQKVLKRMLNRVIFASATDPTRHTTIGVMVKITADFIALAATDGKRLSQAEAKLHQPWDTELSFLLLLKTAHLLLRHLGEEGSVLLRFGRHQIALDLGNELIVSRIDSAEYPNVDWLVPGGTSPMLRVKRADLLSALRCASTHVTPDFPAAKMDVSRANIVISTKSAKGVQTIHSQIPAEYDGRDLSIGLIPGYITDLLHVTDGEYVEFEISGAEKPVILRHSGAVHVVLPVRLN